MFTLTLYVLLFIGGSLALGSHVTRAFSLDKSIGTLACGGLAAIAIQAVIGIVAGSWNLRIAGLLIAVLQCAAIGALVTQRKWGILRSAVHTRFVALPRDAVSLSAYAAIFLALSITAFTALAPVTSWDAGVAHLAVPAQYVKEHAIQVIPGHNYSAYPQFMHTLFAIALGFMGRSSEGWEHGDVAAREPLAVMTVWFFGALACALAWSIGARLATPRVGATAAAILATSPIFLDQATTPSLDLAFTAFVLGAIYAVLCWRNGGGTRWLVIGGFIAGSACGVRHTGYLVVVFFVIGVFAAANAYRFGTSATFSVSALVGAVPWLAHSWRIVGNPVYPFFASYFPESALPDADIASLGTHSSIQGAGLLRLLFFPVALTMNPAHYGGWSTSPGALWLVLGIIGVCVGKKPARALGAFSAAGLAILFFFQRFARYAFPFIAPMMIVAALPLERAPRLKPLIVCALLFSFGLCLAPAIAMASTKFRVITGAESRDAYLSRRVERFPAMAWASDNIVAHGKVLSLDPRGYYFGYNAYTNFEALKPLVSAPKDEQYAWLKFNGIRYVFYPEAYVNDSPAFRETGVGAMIDAWRADAAHFTLVKTFDLPNPRGGGDEHVEIYELRSE